MHFCLLFHLSVFTLAFSVSSKFECNKRTFKNVFSYQRHPKDGMRMRHFPVKVGSGTSEKIKKEMGKIRGKKLTFLSQPNPIETVFGGREPKFCLTIQKMAYSVSRLAQPPACPHHATPSKISWKEVFSNCTGCFF